jgi:hypothetical protein
LVAVNRRNDDFRVKDTGFEECGDDVGEETGEVPSKTDKSPQHKPTQESSTALS